MKSKAAVEAGPMPSPDIQFSFDLSQCKDSEFNVLDSDVYNTQKEMMMSYPLASALLY